MSSQRRAGRLIRFYIAPDGNDRWSGKLPAPNTSRSDGPFATIGRAQLAVRRLKRGSRGCAAPAPPSGWEDGVRLLRQKGALPFPVRIELRGGLYTLAKPLTFTPEDSGSPLLFNDWLQAVTTARDVTYAAYPGETPVISGGRRITSWKETTVHGRRAWVTTLPEVARGRWRFTQLWVNGRRAARTRLPKTGYFRIEKLLGKVSWDLNDLFDGQDRFRFAKADLQAWRNVRDIEFVALHFWIESRVPFRRINPQTREAQLQWKPRMRLSDDHTRNLAHYYVENVFEELKQAGQWYLDRPRGELYYLPRAGERLETSEVIAPRLPQVMLLAGEKERPVTNIAFEGLTFSHSEWVPGNEALTATPQAACHIPGAVVFRGTRNCVLRGCHVTHLGSYGVEVSDGSSEVEIVGNQITDLAAGGVKVWHTADPKAKAGKGGSGADKTFRDGCRQIAITDNEIADGGHRWRQAVGILVGKCGANQIRYNHIHDFDYSGISVGWTWNYGENHADGNVIEHNHVHDVGRGTLSDMGGIYILGMSSGTRVRYNLVHDIESRGYGGWGIYLDGGCSEALVESNLVYRTKSHAFFVSRGRDNMIRNNIFALGREGQASRGSNEQHYSFDFTHNILLGDDSRRVLGRTDKSKELVDFSSECGHIFGGDWKTLRATIDYNLYYEGRTKRPTFAGKTWKQWQRMGADPHSRIANPRFVNPAKGDFRLRPGSPALKLGFVPFMVCVGPRPAAAR